ncbi:hypothetical protein CPB83DRAFT_841101 [Crepidotus variabilis]|uniref:Uncharacterized protein n=1 Tax=Crepidotus variabilis TaxID=179855 RepID=A0A9P6E358_9AGAR|nr:hypothetical protein CPB83DRAFT_841101 [Crepidotus variabilis]
MSVLDRLSRRSYLPRPRHELWAALNISSKATRGEIIWSTESDSEPSASLSHIPASIEDIITLIYDGHRIPPLVFSSQLLLPRVIHGNKIVQALVSFEQQYKDITSSVQKSVIRASQIMVVIYADLTPVQETEINTTYEKHFMRYTSCLRCLHQNAERHELEDKLERIQEIIIGNV